MCYRCSSSRRAIPQDRVIRNPIDDDSVDYTQPQVHRVCDICVPILEELASSASPNASPASSVATTMPTPPSIDTTEHPESRSFEMDDTFLIECPVCRSDLRVFVDEELQALHVATCLEELSASPSFAGSSRHLGI